MKLVAILNGFEPRTMKIDTLSHFVKVKESFCIKTPSNLMQQNDDWQNSVAIQCEVNFAKTGGNPRQN